MREIRFCNNCKTYKNMYQTVEKVKIIYSAKLYKISMVNFFQCPDCSHKELANKRKVQRMDKKWFM